MTDFGREKRKEMDTAFDDAMKKANGWGQFDNDANRKRLSINGRDYKEKTREAQKTAQKIIELKIIDNRKRGRKVYDGQNF